MSIYDHDPRNKIISAAQHLYQHDLSSMSYSHDALPGVSSLGAALNWLVAVIYPNNKPAVATPGDLPAIGNTLLDYRVVTDDGDGKAASYRWEQREGDVAAKWYKIYDIDWGFDSALAGFLDKTQDIYPRKLGYDDLDETGTPLAGDLAGQHLFGGASANTHLTLHANAGDGTGAQTGYVQVTDNFRPTADDTFECGTTGERWSKIWAHDAELGLLTIDDNTITSSTGTVDFVDDIITTGEAIFGGNIRINSSSITNPGSHEPRQTAYCYGSNNDWLYSTSTDFNFNGSSDFTIAAWVNLQSKANHSRIAARWNPTTENACYGLQYTTTRDVFVFVIDTNGVIPQELTLDATTHGSPNINTWAFVVVRFYAGVKATICVNDGTVDEGVYTGSIYSAGSTKFAVGGRSDYDSVTDAYFANIGIWGRCLSDAEVTSLYNQGGGKEYSKLIVAEKVDLISYWNLDETGDGISNVPRLDSHGSNDLTDKTSTPSVLWDRYIGGGYINFDDEDIQTTGEVQAASFATSGVSSFGSGTTIGSMTISNGSIVSGTGAISFGAGDLSTTGTLACGAITSTGSSSFGATTHVGTLYFSGGSITDTTGTISFADEHLTTTGNLTGGKLTVDTIQLDSSEITTTAGHLNLHAATGLILTHGLSAQADNTYDLGGTSNRYKDLYLSNSIQDGTNTFTIANLMTFRAVGSPSSGDSLFWDGSKWVASAPDTEITHSTISGLTTGDAGHTQFALLAGRAGGQSLSGGTAASENLTLDSTAHATKGNIIVGSVLRPSADGTLDLGGGSYQFKDFYIAGQLIGARLANYTTALRPSAGAGTAGRIIWDTDLLDVFIDGGGFWLKMSIDRWEYEDNVTWNGAATTVTYTVDGTVSPERGRVSDARSCIWQLKDNTNSHKNITHAVTIDHPASNQVRITVGAPLPAGTYRLIGIG